MGYQHGYLLAQEILDAHLELKNELGQRRKARVGVFPGRREEHAVAAHRAGVSRRTAGHCRWRDAHGVKLDLWDIVATNASLEWGYYTKWLEKQQGRDVKAAPAEHCSAFVATGSYTKDGRPVIAHNNWSSYMSGVRWNIIFDIAPQSGNHFIMDGMPGLIHMRRRFRHQLRRHHDHRDHHQPVCRMGSERHRGIHAGPESHAIREFDRTISPAS
jgi:hypothetical protein